MLNATLPILDSFEDLERYNSLNCEYETGLFEILKKKKKTVDKIAVQCSMFIYQASKLHFLNFVLVLHKYLRPGSFRLCYCDTDSLMISICGDTFDEIVREEYKDEWSKTV